MNTTELVLNHTPAELTDILRASKGIVKTVTDCVSGTLFISVSGDRIFINKAKTLAELN